MTAPARLVWEASPLMNSLNVPTNANAAVIEAAYEAWLKNPDSVDPTWRAFFQGFTLGSSGVAPGGVAASGTAGAPIIDSLKQSHVRTHGGAS